MPELKDWQFVAFMLVVLALGMTTGGLIVHGADTATGGQQDHVEPVDAVVVAQTSHQVIYRYTDAQAGIVCYASSSGGIDCVPQNRTKLAGGTSP